MKVTHAMTVPVCETIEGKPIWDGRVEVFDIYQNHEAKFFAWGFREDGQFKTVVILGVPPVDTPQKAVQAYLVSLSETS